MPPRSRIADVGGGTGRYAEWLAAEGHEVELVEPVPFHVEQARERAGDPPGFGVHRADARALPFADDTFDAVLILGPLYHLGEHEDRIAAACEARRVCRGGGLVVAAGISRFAPLLDTVRRGAIGDSRIVANIRDETRTGRRVSTRSGTIPRCERGSSGLPERSSVIRTGIAFSAHLLAVAGK
jgi:SAM-dependent methyltransferase